MAKPSQPSVSKPMQGINFAALPEMRLSASPLEYEDFIKKSLVWKDMEAFFKTNLQMGLITVLGAQTSKELRATQAKLQVYSFLLALPETLKQEATDQAARDLIAKRP